MAIAPHKEGTVGDGLFEKEFDVNSKELMFRLAQEDQYQYPEQSTIREITCNGVDSTAERDMARKIIRGEAKPEDFWISRDDNEFKTSNYDPAYYDEKYFSDDPYTYIRYIVGQGTDRDTLQIEDFGVGLGGRRLEGYFKPTWSSKRNSKFQKGKFGLGSKAPLSLGVPSYKMKSYYNGIETDFTIYSMSFSSNVPEVEIVDGEVVENVPVQFMDKDREVTIYGRKTSRKNGVVITIDGIKKHHKDKYVDAVKRQLLYFNTVKMSINDNGYIKDVPVSEPLVYEDDVILMAKSNSTYSKPHIVINQVCYGVIDFDELETTAVLGNIGIKVQAEEVDLTPSRESIKWGNATRATILRRFNDAVDIATNLVDERLKNETDLWVWLSLVQGITSPLTKAYNINSEDPINRLASMVDMNNIKPKFPGNEHIKFYMTPKNFFYGLFVRAISTTYTGGKVDIKRIEVKSWGDIKGKVIPYYTTESANPTKDAYLHKQHPNDTVVLIQPDKDEILKNPIGCDVRLDLLMPYFLDYDEVVVPEEEQLEENAEGELSRKKKAPEVQLTPAEIRALQKRTVCYTPAINDDHSRDAKILTWYKREPRLSEAQEMENVYYVTGTNQEFGVMTALILRSQIVLSNYNYSAHNRTDWESDDFTILRIAQDNIAYFPKAQPLENLILTMEDGKFNTNVRISNWNTARHIALGLEKLRFLNNYTLIDPDRANQYRLLKEFHDKHFRNVDYMTNVDKYGFKPELYSDLCSTLNTLGNFQLQVRDINTNEELSDEEKARQVLELSTASFEIGVTGANALNTEVYDSLTDLLEYADGLYQLFNHVQPLIDPSKTVDSELEQEVKRFVNLKKQG